MNYLSGKIIFKHSISIGDQVYTYPKEYLLLCHFLSSDLRSITGVDYFLRNVKESFAETGIYDRSIAQNTGEIYIDNSITKFSEDFFKETTEQNFYLETDLFFEIITLWRQFLVDVQLESFTIDVEELRASLNGG